MSYIKNDLLNGYGAGSTIWLTQCSHGCKGCFNEGRLSDKYGEEVTEDFLEQILEDLSKPWVTRFTWSGGDGCHQRNRQGVIDFSKKIKKELPHINIWLYTGYTFEQMKEDTDLSEVLEVIDYLVDGRFEESKKVKGELYGSSNQRVIRLK